jgi:hypothetical protein
MPRIVAIFLPVLLLTGCAKSLEGKIGQMHTAVTSARRAAREYLDDKCMAVAKKCAKGPAEACDAWVKCRDLRRNVYRTASAVQLSLDLAASALAVGDERRAASLFSRAGQLFIVLQSMLQKHGLLKGT